MTAPPGTGRRRAPKVAIFAGRSPSERYSVHRGYIDALWAVGAQPVIVPAGEGGDGDRILDLVADCAALIVSGGNDIDPSFYGEQPGGGEQDPDPERDTIELEVVRQTTAAGRPVLGICRGIQVLAVADGGTLIGDLPSAGFNGHWDEEREHEPVHDITADPGTLAARVLAGATVVNSIHHQAVASTGASLRATAWSPDGVIEAVEGPGVLGIQWHPERLVAGDPRHLAPFRWAVTA
ncbi:MAG TPA: gamma-glutamyl-gamma-aminobutyrate hydrolase family protein [Acidimicrobiales bacterium]|nr:gamma-glutamyl-gamma-aminobutyrate hydrolase family protein [Acidimicrobiales bacterium]